MSIKELPVNVLEYPHWRVLVRPTKYEPEAIPTLRECIRLIEQTRVSLRGWKYPPLSPREQEREYGSNWIASWSNFEGHKEYWRFYQSGQFIYLSTVREATEPRFKEELGNAARTHLSHRKDIDWSSVKGYISILNFLYTITEIFEFPTRLCQKGIYKDFISMTIELKGIQGFILTTGLDRFWHDFYSVSRNEYYRPLNLRCDDLVAASAEYSLKTILWFFERFGWLQPPIETLKKDQEKFLQGRL